MLDGKLAPRRLNTRVTADVPLRCMPRTRIALRRGELGGEFTPDPLSSSLPSVAESEALLANVLEPGFMVRLIRLDL